MASIIVLYSFDVTFLLVSVVVRVRNKFKVVCFYVLLRLVFVCIVVLMLQSSWHHLLTIVDIMSPPSNGNANH